MCVEDNVIKQTLFNKNPENESRCFETYKLLIEMADRLSARRQTANQFYFSINTGVIVFLKFFHSLNDSVLINLLACFTGLVSSWAWLGYIDSCKRLNSAKFKIICLVEDKLPFRPYSAEWYALGKGKDKNKKHYRLLSDHEKTIPKAFIFINAILLLGCLFSLCSI